MHLLKTCALSLTLIPALAFAQSNSINCKDFAAEQLKEVKKEYYGALSPDEIELTLNVAERSCRTLFDDVEEERASIQAATSNRNGKSLSLWEKREEEGKTVPSLKSSQRTGGK